MSILRTVSRPLLALPFIVSGVEAAARPTGHRARAAVLAPLAEKAGISLDERTSDKATRALGTVVAGAGIALGLGRFPRTAALLLALLQVPITIANSPWWLHRGTERRADVAGLVAGAGLIGGALAAAADTNGKPSRAWRREARKKNRPQPKQTA